MENTKRSFQAEISHDGLRLISEQEASRMGGVSLETLKRYQEFGLLKPVVKNGIPFFREPELRSLFLVKGKGTDGLVEAEIDDEVPTLSSLLSEVLTKSLDTEHSPEAKHQAEVQSANLTLATEEVAGEHLLAGEKEDREEVAKPDTIVEAPVPARRLEDMIFENRGLKSQVKSLEEERDWLRKRVEQLEERSGREQMLLLSEKETLREVLHATIGRGAAVLATQYGSTVPAEQIFSDGKAASASEFDSPKETAKTKTSNLRSEPSETERSEPVQDPVSDLTTEALDSRPNAEVEEPKVVEEHKVETQADTQEKHEAFLSEGPNLLASSQRTSSKEERLVKFAGISDKKKPEDFVPRLFSKIKQLLS